jgi:adenylosuccinate synthase
MRGEITWDELSRRIGHSMTPEKTTVTHKTRRIAEWDPSIFDAACRLNDPTELALTFCDYIDPDLYGVEDKRTLMDSKPLNEFMRLNGLTDKVKYFGTGPQTVVEV